MDSLNISAFETFDKQWALVTAGTEDSFNTMTVSWGGVGTLWSKPAATVYIRPSRYTYEFLEKNALFTVSFFSEQFKKDLGILGTKSGRDCDKLSLTHLHPAFVDGTVTFREAYATLICKKMYFADMDPDRIPDDVKARYYDGDALHRMYIGEVLRIVSHEEL